MPRHTLKGKEQIFNHLSKWTVVKNNGCWVWTGGRFTEGYGCTQINNKKWRIHILSWMMYNKKAVPFGLEICHICNNPPCWNPAHLYAGTHKQNMEDRQNVTEKLKTTGLLD